MRARNPVYTTVAAILVALCPAAARAQHSGDVFVGRTAAGQLKLGGFIPDLNVIVLPPVNELFNGWSDNNPGFDRVITDDVPNDLLTLQSGVQVRIEVIQVDPAFQAISPSFVVIDDPGERILLGNNNLHIHLTWLINSDEPDFDPLKVLWRATFKLVDTGSTGYTASVPFTFYFANVDCTRGDCDGSGIIDGGDVQKFVDTVLNPAGAAELDRCRADTNRDGLATPDDATSFVELLLAQPS
ncbi:MAG TPA: hypothetical protein VJZ71_12535 [Phycisphaerae bacterium]|nr:hypothetical protein [Phycisphaerae bacterium]